MRYFIRFSYFGKRYHGWQNQPNGVTVQQVLEQALSQLLTVSVSLTGAGRTDAGVHAKEMYAHFDGESIADTQNLTYRLNAFLPDDIAVQDIFRVPDRVHTRFDALERTYEYWIVQEKNPFLRDSAHYVRQSLDVGRMNEAAGILLQETHFECFSKSNTDVKTYTCSLKKAEWAWRDGILVFTVTADRFLRNMVRAIVGTLLEVGTGKTDIGHVKMVLKSRDRRMAGPSVPAKGLYLTQIIYPDSIVQKHG